LLFGVLTGIFFSNAEGVQLFPFPVLENTTEKKSFLLEGKYKSYFLSAHHFSNLSISHKSKSAKSVKDLACGAMAAGENRQTEILYFQSKRNFREAELFYAFRLLKSSSDRAPPFNLNPFPAS
jgi:hypothetical protein